MTGRKGLLDSHTFLWFDSERAKLSSAARAFCEDKDNQLLVSVASLWELQIKINQGRMTLRDPLPTIVREQRENGVIFLPVLPEHVYALDGLPLHHKDPFDRLLIAQAIAEGALLLSADVMIASYAPAVTRLW